MFEIQKAKKPKMKIPNFKYRLPTKAEWELVAKADYSEKTKKEIVKVIKKDPSKNTENFKTINSTKSFFPNSFGIYALKNNVSEFVQEKGIAKGGNFTLSSDKKLIEQKISSVQTERWLGFRCVCEVINE